MRGRVPLLLAIIAGLCLWPQPASAGPQEGLDRADPALVEKSLPDLPQRPVADAPATTFEAPSASAPSADAVMVGAVRVEGATLLHPGDFAPAIEPFIGRQLDTAGLRSLAGAVADVARRQGYVLATAWIPPQRLASGVVVVQIDEGRIDEVVVTGVESPALERTLALLETGAPVRKDELERALYLAGDIPGLRVRESRYRREGGRGRLIVRASQDRAVARFFLDNHGSDAIGPVRLRLGADLNAVLASDDRLRLDAVATPLDPDEFKLIGASYETRVSPDGASLFAGGYYGRSRPSGVLRERKTIGESAELTAGLSHPVARARAASAWASAELRHRTVEQRQNGSLRRDDTLTLLRIGLNGNAQFGGQTVWGGIAATRGLGLFGATRASDPLKSRRDGSARFTKVEAHATWNSRLAERLSVQVAATAQIASRPLLSSEEFGLGGPRFVRGYDYSERLGDEGVAGSAELRFDPGAAGGAVRRTELYLFADGGVASNIGGGRGGGSLASAGAGARVWLGKLWGGAELAAPLTGARFESGDRKPRLLFTLGGRF